MTAPTMDAFSAAMIADGEFALTSFDATRDNFIAAYQFLIDTGMAWTLQGRIGRTARDMIEAGDCIAPGSEMVQDRKARLDGGYPF